MNKDVSVRVTAKSIQDGYKKIQDAFDRRYAKDSRLSGWVEKLESSVSFFQ